MPFAATVGAAALSFAELAGSEGVGDDAAAGVGEAEGVTAADCEKLVCAKIRKAKIIKANLFIEVTAR